MLLAEPRLVKGYITSVSKDGRFATVKLVESVGQFTHATISQDTDGRMQLMNGRGRLRKELCVMGQAVPGLEAMDMVSVRPDHQLQQELFPNSVYA